MDEDLADHPAIESIRTDGFLSVAIERTVPALRDLHGAWFDLAKRSNRVGQRIMNSAEAQCIGCTTHDPVCVATRLLLRTMSGFQGTVILAERGMTVEADTLVRGLYENSLWLGYLFHDSQSAVGGLITEELFSQRGRQQALLDQMKKADHPDAAMRASLAAMIASADVELKGKKKIGIAELAARAGLEDFYMFYRQLSSESAHPSFHSLAQHLEMSDDGTWSGHVTGPDGDGIAKSLNLGSHALLSCLAAFNGIWAGGDGASEVTLLQVEHARLADVSDEE